MQTNRKFDFLVFIGRFQPFHSGHLRVLRQGLDCAERMILLCGSAWQPRSSRNPWTFSEVETMIRDTLGEELSGRIDILPLMDVRYNERQWVRSVQDAVRSIVGGRNTAESPPKIGLIGLAASGANYYPSRFPQWEPVAVEEDNGIRGVRIRSALFGMGEELAQGAAYLDTKQARTALPEGVWKQLKDYCTSAAYHEVHDEAQFIAKYRQAWSSAPYPPTFVTVDAVVIQSGHILLVERRAQPGKGLFALPGGFLRGEELLEEGCLRELREETRLKVPAPVLKGSIRARQVFDDPYRSQRGRTITHAFLIELEPNSTLPKVKGGDDAQSAFWLPLADLQPEKLFEDHYFIIQAMLG